jgi:hypothetical protein
MRYWLDTEFAEDGRRIELLSIGIVAEDGRELYRENLDPDMYLANDWVREHVLPQLVHRAHGPHVSWDDFPSCPAKFRAGIRDDILEFCNPEQHGKPEFWGFYADYDWVVLCQLFGAMVNLPKGFPMYCRDLKQWADELGNPALPEQGKGEHHALADARHNRVMYEFLEQIARGRDAST